MDNILFFNESIPEIGLKVRKFRTGAEFRMVENFVDYKVTRFEKVKNRKTNLAVFYEPLVETGFPDIVFAEYNPDVFNNWPVNRSTLKVNDFKVFNHIVYTGGADGTRLQQQLGINSKSLLLVIERLIDAGLIVRESKKWKAKKLKDIFGLSKLIAVEAKINNWGEVLNQAQLNKWFASESYTLTPVSHPTDKIIKKSDELGIGIYISSNTGIKKIKPSPITHLPSCYGSLLFNEWIGKRLMSIN